MKSISLLNSLLGIFLLQSFAIGAKTVDLFISAKTTAVESDNSALYYSSPPLLLGNDGSAATGGFHIWNLDAGSTLKEVESKTPSRTKLVATVYDIGNTDLIITIAQPDSVFRVFDAKTFREISDARKTALGDWSALCPWKSFDSGNQYFFLFGKKQAVQYLIRKYKRKFEIVEIQTFNVEVEASSCAVSSSTVFFSSDDNKKIYAFEATESTSTTFVVHVLGKAGDDVTGLAIYLGTSHEYILVAQKDVIDVYSTKFSLLGSMKIVGKDVEVQGLSVFQGKTKQYPAGALAYAIEDADGKAFAVSSLKSAFESLKLNINTRYNPGAVAKTPKETISKDCNYSGFGSKKCSCFPGFSGKSCQQVTCTDKCSGHGKCIGPNECRCDKGWGGLHCSFLLVQPKLETEAYGGDGDDPAIWISPISPDHSRIITTIKSEEGAGLAVFDLGGYLLQTLSAGEPNNVDMIYNFTLGDRTVDLAYAACREDNTLCLFEMSVNGTLSEASVHPVINDYKVYGSCTYRSPSGVQYLFVNSKTAEYLQYSLISVNGKLVTTMVRSFIAGSGGQVEGCVVDNENGFLFVGEEPVGLWRYDANPVASKGVEIAKVATYHDHQPGDLYSDVEGVALIPGKTPSGGFIIVSCQGVSGYNVYKRAPPHAFVETFTIVDSKNVDHVSNTDGIAAVGNKLNAMFPSGLLVTHDDANELKKGTSSKASFKLVSLADVLSHELLRQVDADWNPRS